MNMTDQDKIIHFLRVTGPSLPAKVAKMLVTDILLASASLSDLAAQGKVKVSFLKIGGSPLYYLPGQESQLYQFAAGNINPKDLHVLNGLKERKVLRESSLELLEKVALRNLRDFALPLRVTLEGKAELFWKWSLLSAEEANQVLTHLLYAPAQNQLLAPEIPVSHSLPTPESVISRDTLSDVQSRMSSLRPMPPPSPTVVPMLSPVETNKEGLSVEKTAETEDLPEERSSLAMKKPLLQRVRERISKRKREDELLPYVEEYCRKLKIAIEQKETIRKNAEMEFMLKVPSAVGMMTYFCKAKHKSKCDEKDLSAAYMQAQIKKLPLLLLHTGELTKKAQEMLESGAFENSMVKKIG